jgi:hypothetical protein
VTVAAKPQTDESGPQTWSMSASADPMPDVIRVLARILVRQALVEAQLIVPENDNG